MAFSSDFQNKLAEAREAYRRSTSEMRRSAAESSGETLFSDNPEDNPEWRKLQGAADVPADKQRVDGYVDILLDPEGNNANMVLHAPQNGGRPITARTVLGELSAHGVTTGIDELDIRDMVDGKVYDTPICVARAIPPIKGKNGEINYRYEKQHVPRPAHDEFGVANFRELNMIVPIKKGDVIADITPPTSGEPGVNVFGKPIKAQPGEMPSFNVGKNTLLTADGRSIVASCNGHVLYSAGGFNVEDTVTVKTDLDISVGNISFDGDVVIKGNVMDGFSIKAGRNVRIEGTAFSASITAAGNVVINGGAVNSKIECEGSVYAGFCDKATIKAKGKVESAQFAFCDIFCYNELIAKGSGGVIFGGKITCMKNITAGIIGNEKYTATEINIGDGSVICARKRQAEAELAEAQAAYTKALKNVEFLKSRKESQGGVLTDIQSKQMKTETQNKVVYSVRCKSLEELIAQLEADLKHRDDLCAKITGTLYPGAHFCINYLSLDVTEVHTRAKVCVIDDELQITPI